MQGVEESSGPTEWGLRCAALALDHQQAGRTEVEAVLTQLSSWSELPVAPQVLQLFSGSGAPAAVVRVVRKFRDEAPLAALACVVMARVAGSFESVGGNIRSGAVEEVMALMDRHPSHGGVQNVCLLTLSALLKDNTAARQAVSAGCVGRVLRALEVTNGREVQFNGLATLRNLADNGRAPRAGLQEAALRAKVAHHADAALCSMANEVLALVTPRFKEVLCWHWQSGWCKLGPRCTYAHGPSDLRGGTGG